MKNIWRKVITVALAVSLVANTYETKRNPLVHATEVRSDTSISTSNYKATNITLSIKNENLVFEDLPDEPGFQKMILVSLYSDKKEETIGKKQLTVASKTTYSLSEVADGTYYVQLYYLDSSGLKFKSYWLKKNGVKIKKTGNKITILESDTYESNTEIYKDRTNSNKALAYYLEPDSFVDCDNPVIKEKALEITNGITNDYDKVKAVHDWVADNIWYDYDGLNKKTEVSYISSEVLETKKSVCQGFADLAAALLRSIGIPTKVTNGYAMGVGTGGEWTEEILTSKESNHAWNEAYVDGRWVIFDSTWDSDNKYINGKFSEGTGCTGYCYFDLTLERFSDTHYIIDKEERFLKAMAKKIESVTCQEYIVGKKGVVWDKEYTIPDLQYQFESANEEIATVDEYGVVTGITEGRVNLTVILTLHGVSVSYQLPITIEEGNGEQKDASIEAPISEKIEDTTIDVPDILEEKEEDIYKQPNEADIYEMLQRITPSEDEVNLIYGGTKQNSVQLLYYCDEEIQDKFKITYWIEDSSVAKISSNGIITAKGAGETTLHITYQVGEYKVKDEIDIYVEAAKIKIIAGNKKIKKGKSKKLTAKASNITGKIKWKSSNKKIATVSSKGKVFAKRKGKVKITAYIGNVKSSLNLTVY